MAIAVSVVIPALNEERWIGRSIAAALAAGAREVIVSDGGSSDGTVAAATTAGARIVTGERMRARQLNRGAEATSGDLVMFVHADTLLPQNGCEAAARAIEHEHAFGGFRIAFIEPDVRLQIGAALINIRTVVTRQPWGDQAQFLPRDSFLAAGGFREIPIMEDYELASRMRSSGRVAILREHVHTSGRRFLERGVLRTVYTNWRVIAAWHRGADPAYLAELYRGR